ncbi:transcriptional regulator [Bacteroidia bacterium]|nr:transcriptional regulator [Bacteroidia bacterium]
MALKKDKPQKLYFSIGEVARMFGENESTLRYWEDEFETLTPKTVKGSRFYKQENIEQVRIIHYLLRKQKFKIAGAKIQLKNNKDQITRQAELSTRLQSIKEELLSLKAAFDIIDPTEEETTDEGTTA